MNTVHLSNTRLVFLAVLASIWFVLAGGLETEEGKLVVANLIAMIAIAIVGFAVYYWPSRRTAQYEFHWWRS